MFLRKISISIKGFLILSFGKAYNWDIEYQMWIEDIREKILQRLKNNENMKSK